MDSVRFGRTLGVGARLAGRALSKALEPAPTPAPVATPDTTPANTSDTRSQQRSQQSISSQQSASSAGQQTLETVRAAGEVARIRAAEAARQATDAAAQAHATMQARAPVYRAKGKAVARGTKRFGEAIWGPLLHVSAVLWLEITGVFFALFALFFGQQTWLRRTNYVHGPEHAHFLMYAAVFLMFAYFSASSFLRARQKSRRRQQEM